MKEVKVSGNQCPSGVGGQKESVGACVCVIATNERNDWKRERIRKHTHAKSLEGARTRSAVSSSCPLPFSFPCAYFKLRGIIIRNTSVGQTLFWL